jgi:hypothetical protein
MDALLGRAAGSLSASVVPVAAAIIAAQAVAGDPVPTA